MNDIIQKKKKKKDLAKITKKKEYIFADFHGFLSELICLCSLFH